MAANSTAANAAALAAFNAGKKKDDSKSNQEINKQQTKQIKLRTPSYHNSPRISTPSSIAHKKYGNYASDMSSPSSVLSPQVSDYLIRNSNSSSDIDQQQHQQLQPDYFALSPHNYSRSDLLKQNRHSPHTPKDMINNVKNSIDSKAIIYDANSKRLSMDYSPQEMLKNLKNSLNNKSKAQVQKPKIQENKGQDFVNDMREKIDNTMKSASNNLNNLTLSPGLEFENPVGISKFDEGLNSSYSSFESQLENRSGNYNNDRNINHSTHDINRITNSDSQIPKSHGIDINITDHDDDMNPTTTTRIAPSGQEDIIVPVKLSDIDRSSVSSKVARRKPPPLSNTEYPSDSDVEYSSTGENDEFRTKMMLNAKSADTFSSGEFLPSSTDDIISLTDNEEPTLQEEQVQLKGDSKFPQFPEVKKHHHHHHIHNEKHLFRKKRGPEFPNFPDLDQDNSDEEINLSQLSNQPNQKLNHSQTYQSPVQFKKTMRKTNKRKEKKSKFDEYKPWKNHNELNYLTDSERKRYEGVWVSNKGLYMNSVVTKLNGVNYKITDSNKVMTEHHEDSMKAALISTNLNHENEEVIKNNNNTRSKSSENFEDLTINNPKKIISTKQQESKNKLHNLDDVEINQLILGCVVKRIWNRSRLPNDILQQIWNLVDFRRDGSLNKNEFIVGMWLVDQCLYGKKLPKKLEPIVWESLGGIGVNVNLKKMK
ncbi:IRS4 [Candida jiufengensis]|uniref:IRS4 n=1 Tax=Candida jiufengensis TaxID=497108 RepID=UPI00222562DB|nr:IRS4 [Candida jiufengensis]KAI5952899.1 IRS4 [Candida jiufengensis]